MICKKLNKKYISCLVFVAILVSKIRRLKNNVVKQKSNITLGALLEFIMS